MAEKKEKQYVSDNAQLMAEWHWGKNQGINPHATSTGSGKKVWWIGNCGHEWEAIVGNRSKGSGCPICSGKQVLRGYNDLKTVNPPLSAEWHPSMNQGLLPSDVVLNSHKKVWWLCPACGYGWEASVKSRANGHGCPRCAGREVVPGVNDLQTQNPQLATEWHYEKNYPLLPNQLAAKSGKKVWWKCNLGHEWQADVYTRQKRGCPYCTNRKVLPGYNDLATHYPHLSTEWHPTKNGDRLPTEVPFGSAEKAWWICKFGHEWETTIVNRSRNGSGCPFCSHLLAIPGETDLVTQHPQLAAEWHPIKNGNLHPENVLPGSEKRVWWMCEFGHEWETKVVNRCKKGTGCPFCSGRKAIPGKNDIASKDVFLAREWNRVRNGMPADAVPIRSGVKYWWTCSKCGFEWQASPHNRANGSLSTGCPKCAKETQTSYPEQVIFYYISKHYPDAVNRFTGDFLGKMELDIFIPSLKIGIEYDGVAWHSNEETKKREKEKYSTCKENGVCLIRVCEELPKNADENYDYIICANRHPTNAKLRQVLRMLSELVPMEDEFPINDDEQDVRAKYIARFKENSLENLRPNIARNWNYKKNKSVFPDMVTLGSQYKAWWVCERGHEWQTTVSAMVKNRDQYPNSTGCPYCAGQRVIPGETDLKTLAPHLAQEWNYVRNKDVLPEQTAAQSNKKAWWICQYGHEWEAAINSRYRGLGCPYCSGRRILPGYNDFATKYSVLMTEWDFDKNTFIDPTRVGAADKTKVWWICEKGHQYEAAISNRSNGQRCPYCTGKKVFSGINDLVTLNPEILSEWDYEKNDIDPHTVSPNSHQKAWWKCSCGHSWEAEIRYRSKGRGCPECNRTNDTHTP